MPGTVRHIETVLDKSKDFEERLVQRFRELLRKGFGSVKVTVTNNEPQSIEVVTTER